MLARLESTAGLRVFGNCSKEPTTRVAFLPSPSSDGTYRIFASIDGGVTYHEGASAANHYTGREKAYFPSLDTAVQLEADPEAASLPYRRDQLRYLPGESFTEYEALPPMIFSRWIGAIDETTLTTYLAGDDVLSGTWKIFVLQGEPRNCATGTECVHGPVTMPYRSLVVVTTVAGKELILDGSESGTPSSYGGEPLVALTSYKYRITVEDDGKLSLRQQS